MAKLLFEDGRVQIEAEGVVIWLDEGTALMLSHLIAERLAIPSATNPRFTYERGFGPGDGDGHVLHVDSGGFHSDG